MRRVVGATRALTAECLQTPSFFQVQSAMMSPDRRPEGNLSSTGSYGDAVAPFVPGADGELQKDMKLNLPRKRFFEDRRQLLSELDRLRSDAGSSLESVEELRSQAYELLLGGKVSEALDISLESKQTLERYDTTRYARPKVRWDKAARGKRRLLHRPGGVHRQGCS